MGKVDFSPVQKIVFEEFSKTRDLTENFYLTGGTALSTFYLNHRYSDDFDFFTSKNLPENTITFFIDRISKLLNLKYRFTKIENTRIFEFEKEAKLLIKVDFATYPYHQLNPGRKYQGVSIDSSLDIATNKLSTISQRHQVKDYVDLYFLLKIYSVWDLIYAVEKKFRKELDILLLSSDFLSVEDFDFLPKMILPLTLPTMKEFFKHQAKKLSSKVIE